MLQTPKIAAVTLIASLTLIGCTSTAPAGPPPNDVVESSAAPATGSTLSGSGYSFSAPEGWAVPDDGPEEGLDMQVMDQTETEGFTNNLNVLFSSLGEVSPEDAEKGATEELTAAGATNVKIQDRAMIAGSEAAHLSSSLTFYGLDYNIEQFSTAHDGKSYILTFSFSPTVSEADRNELAESVLATWVWA